MKKSAYDSSSIKRFAGLLGIRKKPTPYIGPPDSHGLWTCWREPCDNCVDQALAGRNTLVHLAIDPSKKGYWVVDAGSGIPVGVESFLDEHGRKEKLNTLYVATGLTHAGSNFDSDIESRGTHGLGIKTTNAMSKSFIVWTCFKDQWWCIEYKDAKILKQPYKCKAPKLPHGIKVKSGTVVYFEPDLSLFHKGSKMELQPALDWCQLTSYLVPTMTVKLTRADGKTKSWKSKGLKAYLDEIIERDELNQTGRSFIFNSPNANVAVAFTDSPQGIKAYTNGLLNTEGGVHLKALTKALYDSLKEFAPKPRTAAKTKSKRKSKSRKSDGPTFTVDDVCDGLIGLVNFKIAAPQFHSQVKDKLTDDRVHAIAYPQFLEAWTEFWSNNKTMAKTIVTRAIEIRSRTSNFLADKRMVKSVGAATKGLKGKLAGVLGKCPVDERELFIVEGDSAGGSAKKARDNSFQAVYPIRGKPLNVMDVSMEKILVSKEIAGLLAAMGVPLGESKRAAKKELAYGKIIQLADADVDGMHINTLLLAAIYRFAPWALGKGNIYSVRSPLYKGRHKDKVYFGMTKQEVWDQAGSKIDTTYLKGWGEVSPEDLAIALDPSKRTLIHIDDSDAAGRKAFEQLMGSSPVYRKKLLGVE